MSIRHSDEDELIREIIQRVEDEEQTGKSVPVNWMLTITSWLINIICFFLPSLIPLAYFASLGDQISGMHSRNPVPFMLLSIAIGVGALIAAFLPKLSRWQQSGALSIFLGSGLAYFLWLLTGIEVIDTN